MTSSPPSISAGIARATITPPIGAILTGFPDPRRRAAQERDPLYATALVLGDDTSRVAVVSCDTQYIHPTVVEEVRTTVEATTGIPRDHVMICCTHTHSGPAMYAHPNAAAVDRAYIANVAFVLAGAVAAAAAEMHPVRLAWGTGRTQAAVNRREVRPDGRVVLGHNPSGPVDPTVTVLRVDGQDGRPLASVVNYACHPVVLGGESRAISADYVGHLRQAVEATTGSTMLFVQGACGDINPRLGPAADEGQAMTIGLEVAGAALAAWAGARPVTPGNTLGMTARLPLPLLDDTSMIPDLISPDRRQVLERDIDQWEPWAATLERDPTSGRQTAPIELQALSLGGVVMIGVPAELFVEIGLALKARQADRHLIVAGYSNGCVGYVPMPAAYPLGGYEIASSFVYPRLPAPLAPTCGEQIIEAAERLLRGLPVGQQQ